MSGNKQRQVIAVDIDDVIIETAPLILAYYNREYGTNIQPKDMYSRNLAVWEASNPKTVIYRVEKYMKTNEFQKAIPPRRSIAAAKRLAKRFELHAVTSRTSFLETVTEAMLEQYFPGVFISVEHTEFFGNKSRSKTDACQMLGADFLIDDHLHHALGVAKCGINVLLFGNHPWNQVNELPENVTRVKDWAAVLQYFNAKS